MATIGGLVRFVYLYTGVRPADPEENTIYFAPESQSIYVGDVPIVDGIRLDSIETSITNLNDAIQDIQTQVDNPITVVVQGSGSVLVDASYDSNSRVLTLQKGSAGDGLVWDVV